MPRDEVERTIARARRSRNHVLRVLDAIERAPALTARSERSARAMRISIACAALTTGPVTTGIAHNLNRPIKDVEQSRQRRGAESRSSIATLNPG